LSTAGLLEVRAIACDRAVGQGQRSKLLTRDRTAESAWQDAQEPVRGVRVERAVGDARRAAEVFNGTAADRAIIPERAPGNRGDPCVVVGDSAAAQAGMIVGRRPFRYQWGRSICGVYFYLDESGKRTDRWSCPLHARAARLADSGFLRISG